MKKILLFDIHGTLIDSDDFLKNYEAQLTKFASEYFNRKIVVNFDGYHGFTERYNLKNIFFKQGLKISESQLDDFFAYSGKKYISKKGSIKLIPYVLESLEKLKGKYYLGLVTGSPKLTALKCLEYAGIENYFLFGVFGDESYERSKLVEKAIENFAKIEKSKFDRKNIYVIGDTINDIEAGKKAGVKTIAVLTGSGTKRELEKLNPDFIINNLSELEKTIN